MKLSNYWYEKLPMLYLLAALLVLLVFGNPGIFSALLLLGAAGLTRWWRTGKYYRRLVITADGRRHRERQARPVPGAGAVKRSA